MGKYLQNKNNRINMRIIFMGSAEIAIPSLQSILQNPSDQIVGIISQPDRPAGRKRTLTPSPLKAYAKKQNLTVLTPEKISEVTEQLATLKPDLIVVVAYGQYIPSCIINLAPHKAINLHPSLLPKYRGAAPIQWTIANGDTQTGVSIIYVDKKMDAGDILNQATYPIHSDDTSATLHNALAQLGATLLQQTINDIRNNTLNPTPQNENHVIEITKLTKQDGKIDWTQPATTIRNRIRAFNPWPGTYCTLPNGSPLKIWKAEVENATGTPGQTLDDNLLIATAKQALRLIQIQPPGKQSMPASDYLRGHPIPKNTQLT